ncbi:MAG: hypothetical protein M3340_03570 [Actinomycetota bacterium]|nr:hypothetical protein [Actinomycetota bacterium]
MRLDMTIDEAEQLRDRLIDSRGSLRHSLLHDALWLRTVLVEQRRRVPLAERDAYTRRADAILTRFLTGKSAPESVRSRDYGESP